MDKVWANESLQKKLRKQLEKRIKINDIISMILGIFGLVLAFFEVEEFYGELEWSDEKDDNGDLIYTVVREQHEETSKITTMRVFIGISSGILAITIMNHYNILLKIYKLQQKAESTDTLKSSGLLWWMLAEVGFSLIHCPPGFNYVFEFEQHGGSLEYSFDELTFIVMIGRVYLLWRIFINHSSWNGERAEEICHSCLCEGGVSFAIKAELKERPYLVVTCVLLVSIFAFGIALRNAERPFKAHSLQDWDYIWNGMWCIIITMTTVGFGDFYARTHLGRIIGVLSCFWGTFLVSMMVVSLTISSELTPQERKAYIKIKKDEAVKEIEGKAIDAIKFSLRLWIFLKQNPYATERQKAKFTNQFKTALIDYRTQKRNLIASKQDASIDYILYKLNDKVAFGLDKIKSDCMIYKSLLVRLDNAETNQQKLREDIHQLSDLNKKIIDMLKKVKEIKDKERNFSDSRAIKDAKSAREFKVHDTRISASPSPTRVPDARFAKDLRSDPRVNLKKNY
jgi:hypothetical protein